MQYIIGEKITVISDSIPGENRTVELYEWKWDDIQISNTSLLNTIEIDTVNESMGIHIVSLRILNDCGEWSNIDSEMIELFEEEIPEPEDTSKYILLAGIVGLFVLKNKK